MSEPFKAVEQNWRNVATYSAEDFAIVLWTSCNKSTIGGMRRIGNAMVQARDAAIRRETLEEAAKVCQSEERGGSVGYGAALCKAGINVLLAKLPEAEHGS